MAVTATPRRLLLIGAGYTARLVADEFVRHQRGEELVAALDDDHALHGYRIGPAVVVGPIASLDEVAASYAIGEVVVAIPSLSGARLRDITIACRRLGLPVRTMPGIVELLGRSISPRQLRPVEVADLLRRTEVRCDDAAPAYLRDQRVLITGAGGSIGRELARQVCRAQPEALILLGHGENSIHAVHLELAADPMAPPLVPVIADVRDRRVLSRVFAAQAPTLVFHAAAHKHVPLMELHPAEAVRNNVVGTLNVVRCAEAAAVSRLILVSTDKAVAPTSVMGASKRVCEWIVRDGAARTGRPWVSVRFGNVLGSRGSVVPLLEQQIGRGGPVTLTHPEMSRFFMTIAEAVYLVLQAGGLDDGGRLYVLDMGAPMRIVDLAADLIELSGARAGDIPVVFTGLRPGEKLTEALWEEGSGVLPTGRRDILRVEETEGPPAGRRLLALVRDLAAAARAGDDVAIRLALKAAVPSSSAGLAAPAR